MLRQLRARDERFKTVSFKPGLNLLISDTTQSSTETDTRNSVGKSSMIELLHFLLGATRSNSLLNRDEIRDIEFQATLDWPNSPTRELEVRRSAKTSSSIYLDPDVRSQAAGRDGPVSVNLLEWQQIIERDLFSLPSEHPGVSGRALLSLLIRRISANAFNEPIRTHPQQTLPEATTNVAYLLGLDWKLSARYRELSARESTRRQLAAASKDPVWGRIVGRASELRGQITVAQQRVQELERQIASFQVVPEYENLQAQADDLNERIRQMRTADVADRQNLRDLEAAVDEETDPDVSYLEAVYDELGVTLGDSVRRRFDEFQEFHASVIRNRRSYLDAEITALRNRLAEREADRSALGERQAEILRTLNEGGALEALTALQQAVAQERASLGALRHRFDAAQTLESSRAEIKADRSRLEAEVRADLLERDRIIDDISVRFLEYATRLYGAGRQAYLEVDPTSNYLRFTPHIDSMESRGIGNMVMFCFDLTVAVTAHRGRRGPDFLVHDSHLFDGVDERQIARALSLAKEVTNEEDMQYIATMNSDDLARAIGQGSDVADDIIAPRLTDQYEDGGLFGFRF